MRIVFHKRSLKEIRGRLLTKEWEVSSLLGFIGIAILIAAVYVSVLCIHELTYCDSNKLKRTYQIVDTVEAKDGYRSYPYIHITTKNGSVYHISDYALENAIKEEVQKIEVATGQLVKIQYYEPLFSTPEIRGLSTEDEVFIDVKDSCKLSRTNSLQLLLGAIVAIICSSVVLLPLAMGIMQIKSKSGKIYIQ